MISNLSWQKITLKLRNPFRLSYGTSEERQAYWIRLKDDEGWGEGTIPPYYGVDPKAMLSIWQRAAVSSAGFPEDPDLITDWIGSDGPAPARCGLDLALHDRIARKHDLPLHRLLELPDPTPKPSSFTISLDEPEIMAGMAQQVSKYPIIKVKLGGDQQDMARLKAIRNARPEVALWVDANAGWGLDDALGYIAALEDLKIEMLEQPLAKEDIFGMGLLQRETTIPIVADESVQAIENIEALADAGVRGVNLKLMKVGGIAPALRMIKRSKELGLELMLGCMIETSIGTTAMAHLSGFASWLDLDASLLITNDPFEGMILDENCTVIVPQNPGIGITRISID